MHVPNSHALRMRHVHMVQVQQVGYSIMAARHVVQRPAHVVCRLHVQLVMKRIVQVQHVQLLVNLVMQGIISGPAMQRVNCVLRDINAHLKLHTHLMVLIRDWWHVLDHWNIKMPQVNLRVKR